MALVKRDFLHDKRILVTSNPEIRVLSEPHDSHGNLSCGVGVRRIFLLPTTTAPILFP